MIFEIFAAAVFTVVVGLILYARWNYGTLESLGFTVVKPLHVIFGNTANFKDSIVHLDDVERFKKYGPIYGFYEGREPQVHVCDAELIKHIMVKDYDHFNERRDLDFGSPLLNEMPDFLKPYNKWKAVRALVSPSFTGAKMKNMSSTMIETLEDFVNMYKEEMEKSKSGKLEKRDIRQEIYTMLTDLITRCIFSIKIENKSDPNNYFAKIVKAIIEGPEGAIPEPGFANTLVYSFPFLQRWLLPPLFNAKAGVDFAKTIKDIMKARRMSGSQQKDFVSQLMEWMDKLDTPNFKDNHITELTLLCQALVVFFAGQDQFSTITAHTIREVAKNKEVREKITAEMDAFLEKHDGKITYDNMTELTYLVACITESTRLVPFFSKAERVCTKDWEKDGIKIKKGIPVIVPIWAANRNPEYFPEPDVYKPERFLSPNKEKLHPYAMASFGFGPRSCIGMRFATDTMLLTAAHLIKHFRFETGDNPQTMEFFPGIAFFSVAKPVYIDILAK